MLREDCFTQMIKLVDKSNGLAEEAELDVTDEEFPDHCLAEFNLPTDMQPDFFLV